MNMENDLITVFDGDASEKSAEGGEKEVDKEQEESKLV